MKEIEEWKSVALDSDEEEINSEYLTLGMEIKEEVVFNEADYFSGEEINCEGNFNLCSITEEDIDDKTLENYCSSLQLILSVENESDITANDLREELRDVSRMLPYSMKPLDVLNYLCQNSLISLYPNTIVALRILLTLPVSVASGERSFSKLKLIKHYLRSSIGQTKLKNLSIISIESTMAGTLDYTSVINEFAKVKVRRIKL